MTEQNTKKETTSASPLLVIVPCLDEALHLETLITHLLEESSDDLALKVIIADGGSTDGTVNIAKKLASKYAHVHYLHNPGRIQSAAINLAVQEYGEHCDYFLRIDAHAGYPQAYCKTLLDDAIETGADSVVVAMETVGKNGLQRAVAAAQNSKMGNGGAAHRNSDQNKGRYVDHGHHALMRIDAFQSVGGYDEDFSHNEDAELDKRLVDAGYKIWLSGRTHCMYYPRDRFSALFRQYMRYGQGRLKTLIKHKMKPKVRQMIPAAIAPICLIALLSGLLSEWALPFWIWVLLCLGYGAYLGKKQDDRDVMLFSGLAAMTMHLAWSVGFWTQAIQYLWRKYS